MYDCDKEEDFDLAWTKLIIDYSVHENNWIKSMYKKEKRKMGCVLCERSFYTWNVENPTK